MARMAASSMYIDSWSNHPPQRVRRAVKSACPAPHEQGDEPVPGLLGGDARRPVPSCGAVDDHEDPEADGQNASVDVRCSRAAQSSRAGPARRCTQFG